jgi:hypothetical protein
VGFLDGVISPIYKDGDRATAANYRPICLLGTDYRILGRIMATRLETILNPLIGPEQTAFLRGCLIGDNITLLNLLPELLQSNARCKEGITACVSADLDFQKAYDTVSRPFLRRVMEAAGVGKGLVKWVDTLLSGTQASALVNGYVSAPQSFTAGVRQGCPLAPVLYLFVGWALSCWLKECPGIGIIPAPGIPALHAVMYADDAEVLLPSLTPATISSLLRHLDLFGLASGQYLNKKKTSLLLLGIPSNLEGAWPPPAEVCGIRVVTSAKALGIVFRNQEPCQGGQGGEAQQQEWEAAVEKVRRCYQRIAQLGCLEEPMEDAPTGWAGPLPR